MSQDELLGLQAIGMFSQLIACGTAIGAIIIFFVIIMMNDKLGKIEKRLQAVDRGIFNLGRYQRYHIGMAIVDSEGATPDMLSQMVEDELLTSQDARAISIRKGWTKAPEPVEPAKERPEGQFQSGWENVE